MAIAGGVGLEVDLDPLVEARGCSGETALFGEGPGGFVLAGAREPSSRPWPATASICSSSAGRRRPDPIAAAEADADVALADAERAWRSLGERIESVAASDSAPSQRRNRHTQARRPARDPR